MMERRLTLWLRFVFLALLFSVYPAPSQERILSPVEWALLPKEAYVGDRVELRCIVAPGFELLPPDVDLVTKEFSPEEVWGTEDAGLSLGIHARQEGYPISVHRLDLQRVAEGYSVSLALTPWLPGEIEPGYLDLTILPEVRSLMEKTMHGAVAIHLPKIEVASLSKRMGTRQLRPVAPPMLVPGSIYVVYGLVAALLILLVCLVVVLVKFRQVRLFFRGLSSRARLFRNYRAVLRQLRRLRRLDVGHRDLADQLASLARAYLEGRFARPFTSATTPEIMLLLDEIFLGMLSGQQLEMMENLFALLRRCDFLRYGANSELVAGERDSLIQSLEEFVHFMEGRQ